MKVLSPRPGDLGLEEVRDLVSFGVRLGIAVPPECYLPEAREDASLAAWDSIAP
jgi:hypothetical protein